jgi:hypothetical protein
MTEETMNGFELNSVHLNAAGYKFGIAMMQGEVSCAYTGGDEEQTVMLPLWVNPDKTNEQVLVAILGSEPKVGEQEEVTLPQHEVKNLIYTEPVRIK